jgi:hypothetical protein
MGFVWGAHFCKMQYGPVNGECFIGRELYKVSVLIQFYDR